MSILVMFAIIQIMFILIDMVITFGLWWIFWDFNRILKEAK